MRCLLLVLVFACAGSSVGSQESVDRRVVTSEARYEASDGEELVGYVARPLDEPADGGAWPIVIVVHHWYGVDDYTKRRAEMVAQLGAVAFAADMYGGGEVAEDDEAARPLATAIYTDRLLMRDRLSAAIEAASAYADADGERVGAIGYCFGGTVVLDAARSGMDLDAVVSFHGGLGFVDPPAEEIGASVLILNGNEDPLVPEADRVKLRNELEEAEADFMFVELGGAVHSFTVDEAGEREGEDDAVAYDEASDERSWTLMQLWLREHVWR